MAEPWVVYLIVNISAMILLSALGLKIGMVITEYYSTRLYGDHCNADSECSSGMNHVCLNGVCNCSFNYYFVSTVTPCRKFFTYYNLRQTHSFNNLNLRRTKISI